MYTQKNIHQLIFLPKGHVQVDLFGFVFG